MRTGLWMTALVLPLMTAAVVQPFTVAHRHDISVASVDTVDVTPTQDTVFRRGSTILTARVVDSIGRPKNATVTWTARNTTIHKLRSEQKDSTGFYSVTVWSTGADTGRAYVVAVSGSKKDSSFVVARDTVCSHTVLGSLNLQPDSATAHRTDTLGLTMAPKDQCGRLLSGQNPTWSSSNAALATVTRVDSLLARVVALDSAGTVYIKAVQGTIRDSVKFKLKHAP